MKQLSAEHLLGIKYLKKEDLDLIFETATHFKRSSTDRLKKFLLYETSPLPIYFLKIVPEQNYRSNLLKKGFLPMSLIFQQVNHL